MFILSKLQIISFRNTLQLQKAYTATGRSLKKKAKNEFYKKSQPSSIADVYLDFDEIFGRNMEHLENFITNLDDC